MTHIAGDYLPRLPEGNRPIYVRIADAIEQDIDEGVLPGGSRLPPMRNLAFDIGVTIGTISRAYNLIAERGLVVGEVGRGTYVRGKEAAPSPLPAPFRPSQHPVFDLGESSESVMNLDTTSAIHTGQAKIIAEQFADIAANHSHMHMLTDYVPGIPASWREAGSLLLSRPGYTPSPDTVIATNGAHAGIMAVIMTLTAPGERIVFETATYASIARSAALAGRRIVEAPMDEDGILPDAFEKLCARQHPKLLYLMPSLNNPTLARLPSERREKIAEICRRYSVWIIEDAVYAPLSGDDEPPLASLCPELTFHVASMSKTVSASLRAGWIACPPGHAGRVQPAHRMFSGGGSYPMKELASRLVLSGEAERILHKARAVIGRRHALLCKALGEFDLRSNPNCPFAWLMLPEPWRSGPFREAVLQRGIMIAQEDDFKPARSDTTFHAVRIAFAAQYDDERYGEAFAVIADVLQSGVAGHTSVI
ncbi:PLP-dependent aminotransferase family protein [Salaquimonas pukyongi]|uniref:aminotransferase-like domain-containing protein n=1 Tax=Salaquimonas pukyongi TaxID=2712698 RepID=UPI00096B83FE|nr:PLP-dependent aminotransferase family protein [Salaquimonas pukyongi]